jgi:hypothetical protein
MRPHPPLEPAAEGGPLEEPGALGPGDLEGEPPGEAWDWVALFVPPPPAQVESDKRQRLNIKTVQVNPSIVKSRPPYDLGLR